MKTLSSLLRAVLVCILLAVGFVSKAQFTNSINIGSAQQTVNPTTTYNPWQVTNYSGDMGGAYSNSNTTATVPPPLGPPPAAPVAFGQNALVVTSYPSWVAGTYLSCFPFNTIYTPQPAASNLTNCTMTIRRFFNICSNGNERVNFNMTVRCDDGINSIVIDAGSGSPVVLFTGPAFAMAPPINISASVNLAPGVHTIDIVASDWEDVNGTYYVINGVRRQWNPFGVSITGTVSTIGPVLLNSAAPPISSITGPPEVCAGQTIQLSNATPGGTWSSSNTSIATVDASGNVTGITPGAVAIGYTISQGQCTASESYLLYVTDCHCEDSCNWSLTGNSFVKPWNFIGSLNNADFKIRTFNTERMRVTAAGNVGIGTTAPSKLLDVNGEARITVLPASAPNDRVVMANAAGDLRALSPTGNTSQYLSGNGTWQNLSNGGLIDAQYGLTTDGSTVYLGDVCSAGGGKFGNNREINMNNYNLYFNSDKEGKLFMGPTSYTFEDCQQLFTRLEISSYGLPAKNNYDSPDPSTSGLRFTYLTAKDRPIDNKTNGVLSLDDDGDVIWVKTCCDHTTLKEGQLSDILDRLTKLEQELKASREEAATLRDQFSKMDVVLSNSNVVVLNQNVPNPFNEHTVITYSIPKNFRQAQVFFTADNGEIVKTIDIKQQGKGSLNVFAKDLSSGLYTYTLVIDGKTVATKKMVRQ